MKQGEAVTYDALNRAVLAVQDEFIDLGIWHDTSRIPAVEVFWCSIPQLDVYDALGFCYDHSESIGPIKRLLGYRPGNIYIPHIVPQHGFNQRRGSLRAVLRHEYAHAIAYHYPSLVRRNRRFTEAFSAPYDTPEHRRDMPVSAFVTPYAAESPAEDFAETFMFYVCNRNNGRIKGRHHLLLRKFRYVRWLVTQLRNS